jgi:predicted RNase H-like nuclease (RuvC/YqgF family)
MNLCSDNHDEVCFESRSCPVCELISDENTKIESLEEQIQELKQKLEQAESENDRLVRGQSDGER